MAMLYVNRLVWQILSFSERNKFAENPFSLGQMRLERAEVLHLRLAGGRLSSVLNVEIRTRSAL